MTPKKYWILSFLFSFLGLPLLSLGIILFCLFFMGISEFLGMALLLLGIGFVGYLPFRYGRKVTLPETFLSRYLPLIAPILYTLVAWAIFVPLGVLEAKYSSSWALPFLIPFLPSFPQISLALAFGWRIGLLYALIFPYLFFLLLFALGTWKSGRFATQNNKGASYVLLSIVALLVILGVQEYEWRGRFLSAEQEVTPSLPHEIDPYDYWPFRKENKLTALRAAPAITFRSDYPRLDGATAFFPLYAAAVRAIYLEPDEIAHSKVVQFSRTPTAYENLITGNADMIFALAPSENQKKRAAEQGLALTLTPLAKEAFVFLVHEQNPVQNLSLAEIRAIYSGKINSWHAVGGRNEQIIPFQRPEDSGSQTILLQEVMQGIPVRKPLLEERAMWMGGILHAVADYRNLQNALGYSFRFYAQKMNPVPGIRLLSIDGIAPTPENIRSGRYPLTVDVYMVTARPLAENTQKLRDWFLSPQGQQLVEDVGYIPVTLVAQ